MPFFSQIGGAVSLAVQIVLVVAAVLVFSFFDPFGLFKPSAPTLEDTPVSLKSVRDIGELITAEYYGEVVVSLKGKYIEEIDTTSKVFAAKAHKLNIDFQYAVKALKDQDSVRFKGFNKGQKIKEYFHSAFPDLTSDANYHAFVEALAANLGERNEATLLKRLYKHKIDHSILKVDPSVFEKYKRDELNEVYADNFKRNRQLVLLGRGWVKAGFDFGKFSTDNFKYDRDKGVVHFIGLQPKLLSYTINPWFIPEKGVKGFEIILASNKNNPEHVLDAKREALEKLRSQALERNILEQARANAKENLKMFFSLLLDTEVQDVIFHTSEFEFNLQAITADDTIRGGELNLIDSIIQRNIKIDRAGVLLFIDTLKKYPICYLGQCNSLPQARFAHIAQSIAHDESFTPGDSAMLAQIFNTLNQPTLEDTLWYGISTDEEDKRALHRYKCRDLRELEAAVKKSVRKEFIGARPPVLPPCLY
jgi:hypothetical protein